MRDLEDTKFEPNDFQTIRQSQVTTGAQCYARNCNSNAILMCGECTLVKYCSIKCQEQDWYNSHISICMLLKLLQQI